MRKLFYFLLLFSAVAQAQIVTIPDASFKAKLLSADVTNQVAYGNGGYIKIDANADGEIQETEAQVLDSLNIDYASITDLTGISSFNNLKKLNCIQNQLTDLDLSNLTSLKMLFCGLNGISNLNLTGLTNLNFLDCEYNQLTNLNLSTVSGLEYLDCGFNSLTSLNIAGLSNLQTLRCMNNQLPNIDFSGLINLKYLECNSNLFTNINVSGLINLQTLNCGDNLLTSLDVVGLNNLTTIGTINNQLVSLNVTGLTNLTELNCYNNLLTTLDLTGLINLKYLYCDLNQLTGLDMSGSVDLITLHCTSNQLSSLNVNGLIHLNDFSCANNQMTNLEVNSLNELAYLDCSNNLITTLDCNNNHQLSQIHFSDNPNLTTVLVKNGIEEFNPDSFLNLNCPNLNYVCADDFQTTSLIANLPASVNINTYCSFTPGGNHNTITGTVTFDGNNNGCDTNDSKQPNMKIRFSSPIESGAGFTNTNGNYTFYTDAGSFSWFPDIENPTWFTISPSEGNTVFTDNNNNTVTQDFCITANGSHQDLEIVIVPITPARPGFDAVYKLTYRNKGNVSISNWTGLTLNYDSAKMTFLSASQIASNSSIGFLDFGYSINPFESNSIDITFKINSPVATEPTNIGDLLSFTAVLDPVNTDENPSDNSFQYNQTVIGSFDPNEVTCLEGNSVSPTEIGNYLHYAINFENTGTADAENIVVKDIIDANQFDINSLQLMNSSAPVTARLTGNVAEFIFQNISLHSGGHGNILIKVKSKSNLVQGDMVSKKASIYFDYNAPVDTNMETTTFQTLSATVQEIDASISIYPNPTKGIININCNTTIKSVQLYDVQGRLLETDLVNETTKMMDVSNKAKGVYFLKILSDKGSKVEKIVRE